MSLLTLSDSGTSSGAASSKSSAISSQWYGKASAGASDVEEGRKGAVSVFGGRGGAEENDGDAVSSFRMASRETASSHGGGMIFARRCRLSNRANQRGIDAR